MILKVIINEQTYPIEVPREMLEEAEGIFRKMDADMDRGWQMSRQWVQAPDPMQRCQIAADRLLTAIENENRNLCTMMAAYILKRMPGVDAVDIDTSGDMTQTQILSARP